ncbi:hypothetical protein [Martelella sp. AD-3]|uniref:hypothetical protein n=1 Tax=Martelella sp. AD-3 TaxID=686597 RepID=UPI0004AE828F|nr:hypothetical protein [Martelella sp. AD-3]
MHTPAHQAVDETGRPADERTTKNLPEMPSGFSESLDCETGSGGQHDLPEPLARPLKAA